MSVDRMTTSRNENLKCRTLNFVDKNLLNSTEKLVLVSGGSLAHMTLSNICNFDPSKGYIHCHSGLGSRECNPTGEATVGLDYSSLWVKLVAKEGPAKANAKIQMPPQVFE
jgi:hypothetical protein